MTRFPDAPRGSYVNEDGWLIVGDEAWTEREWLRRPSARPGTVGMGRPVMYADERHRKQRERMRVRRNVA